MPGLVLNVEATSGQKIRRGDTLVMLEAMKMKSSIPAEQDGRVTHILCKANHDVDAGDFLLDVEDSP